jgi:hypothetical protein
VTVTGFGFDNTYAIQNGAGQAEAGIFINQGDSGTVWIGTVAFGFNGGQAWLNCQVYSYCLIYGNIGVRPAQTTATAAALSTGSNIVAISGTSGPPILASAGVHGAGITAGTYVVSYTGGNVTLNQPPAANEASETLTFSDSVVSGIGIGEFSYMTNASNGYVSLTGNPRMPFGMLFVDNNGVMNWANLPVFQKETLQKLTGTGTTASKQITLSTTGAIAASFTAFASYLSAGTTVVSVDDATHATLNNYPIANFTSQPIKIGYAPAQVDGPQLSAWMNSSINLAGSIGMVPGTATTFGGTNLPGSVTSGSQAQ